MRLASMLPDANRKAASRKLDPGRIYKLVHLQLFARKLAEELFALSMSTGTLT